MCVAGLAVLLSVSAAPPRPRIAETFVAQLTVSVTDRNRTDIGEGAQQRLFHPTHGKVCFALLAS